MVGPPPQELLDHLGTGVGGEVEVVAEAAEQGVPHRAADQGELVAGSREPLAELVRDGRHAEQLLDGQPLGVAQRAADGRRDRRLRRGDGHGSRVRSAPPVLAFRL